MLEPERGGGESLNKGSTDLHFSLRSEPRWRAFLANLKILLFTTVARGVSATPAESDLLLASALWYSSILGNLRSVLARKRPFKVTASPARSRLLLETDPWHQHFLENFRVVFGGNKGSSKVTAQPVQTDLLLENRLWFRTIVEELRDLLTPPPVYVLSAQPVPVEPLFRQHRFRKRAAALSLLTHLLVVAAVLWLPSWVSNSKTPAAKPERLAQLTTGPLFLSLPPKAEKSGGGGGGGRREKTPASLGKLPRLSNRQLTPPTPKIVNPDPVLSVEPTVVVPQLARLPAVNVLNLGDPLGIPGPPSSGPGTGGGIGDGEGTGVGLGRGPGVGPGAGSGYGGGPLRVGGGVSAPAVVYRVEPEYSEEARRARYQGSVVLSAIVRKDGTIEILKVIRGLGLGLDESAIAALRQWKFRPGTKAGVPVDVALNVEINFALR